MNEEELNRLDKKLRKISYTLKHKAELAQRKQERTERVQQKARLAIRGTSGGVKVLGGTALIAGSIGAVVAVVASGGTLLPLIVLAGASVGAMFGASDVIEGVGDLTSGITGQGLDQRSYNPVRDTLFGGNELIYAGTEVAVSLGTSATATRVLSGTSSANAESLMATAGRELSREARIAGNVTAKTGTRSIYRAVGVYEYEDIMSTGKFRGVEGKLAAKEFGNSFAETLDFANSSINKDKVAIIKVTIPENVYNHLKHMDLDRVIFKSGTPVVEPEMLDIFNQSIINIEHIF